jgi:hypothetical protein
MAIIVRPNWTDTGTTIISPQTLSIGNIKRATLDLSTSVGAYLYLGVAKSTAEAPAGLYVEVRRTLNAGAILAPGCAYFSTQMDTVTPVEMMVNNGAGYAAATSVFTVDSVAVTIDDDLFFWGSATTAAHAHDLTSTGTALPNAEFARISTATGTVTSITIDSPSKYAHTDNEYITNKANLWQVWLQGGCTYEVIFDYLAQTGKGPLAIAAWSQTLNYYSQLNT